MAARPDFGRWKAQPFDLMIVDIFMPHMRGFEFDQDIPRARAHGPPDRDVRVTLLPTWICPHPISCRMALELGASRCLRKPFTPVALLTVINECLAEVQSRVPSAVKLGSEPRPLRPGSAAGSLN